MAGGLVCGVMPWGLPALAQEDGLAEDAVVEELDLTSDEVALEEPDMTDEVMIVTGSFTPRPARELGSAISLIDEEFLDATQNIIISDILRTVPGLAVSRTGPQGALTQVRIRGAEANQTLTFIDGIEAANPIFGEFNFANLVSADIERIEVIRGPQSALYGPEAIGGVISVITKAPEPGFLVEAEGEGGSFDTYRGFLAVAGGTEEIGARASVQFFDTNGVSTSPTGTEDDGFESLTANLKLIANPFERMRVEGVFRFVDSDAEGDTQEFAFGTVFDSPLSTEAQDLLAKIDVTGKLWGDWLEARAYVAYTDGENVNFNDGVQTSFAEGERLDYGVRLTGRYDHGDFEHILTLAGEREEEDFENDIQSVSDNQNSFVAEYNFGYDDRLFLSGAVRRDFNELFADATTYRVSGAFLIPRFGTRFHGSWGQGVTDPTFFELFGFDPGTFVGNPDLVPEESTGWDIGIEQSFFKDRLVIDATYFNANLENEISTSFAVADDGSFISTPINGVGESERQGVEVTVTAQILRGLTFNGQYTYLDADDAAGVTEVRRAENIASANLVYVTPNGRGTVNLGVDYNGEQEDLFFGFADPNFTPVQTLDAFTLVRLAVAYRITDHIEIFGRGENIFDVDAVEVIGFNPVGAGGFGGVRVKY